MLISNATINRSYIGHKDRTFDVKYCKYTNQILSSSEDGCSKLWDADNQKCIATIIHNKEAEVLRSTFIYDNSMLNYICTAGSDGNAIIWKYDENEINQKNTLRKIHMFEHGIESQIYGCESRNTANELMIAADNRLLIWDLQTYQLSKTYDFYQLKYDSLSINTFGGDRNPSKEVFVFDAKLCPIMDNVIGIALSDSSIRLTDLRVNNEQTESMVISLANQTKINSDKLGHATSLSWSLDSSTILASLGSGKVALIDMRMGLIKSLLQYHKSPCYGAMMIPLSDNNKCLSWSSDNLICEWNINGTSEICTEPSRILKIPEFPILCSTFINDSNQLLCGGGLGSSSKQMMKSFLGTPIHLIII